eukprot:2197230-Rhodomonas_salina.2
MPSTDATCGGTSTEALYLLRTTQVRTATSRPPRFTMSGTGMVYAATTVSLCSWYAMSGTDMRMLLPATTAGSGGEPRLPVRYPPTRSL